MENNQFLEAAIMTNSDNDVLPAASTDEKSDWILDLGSAYHLCKHREMFSTYAAYDGGLV